MEEESRGGQSVEEEVSPSRGEVVVACSESGLNESACNTDARRHRAAKHWDGLGRAGHIVRSKHYTHRHRQTQFYTGQSPCPAGNVRR